MKKNPYDSQKTYQISEEERAARNKTLGTAENMISPASGALAKFYSPTGTSEYAKTQNTARESNINKNFNNTLASQRQRANVAGFGYTQPAEQAGETNVENARAAALSQSYADTQKEANQMALQAIGQQNSLANTELGVASQYSPESYYQTATQQNEDEQARRGGLWKSLARMGLTAASPFTGGTTGAIAKSI